MSPMNIFIGVPQSKYAGIAILISLVFVAFAMIFGKEQVPVGQKFLFVLLMFVVSLPSILFLLFQLTCLVTGAGAKNQRWWCAAYAWIGTIFVIMYSVIIVVVGIMSMMNGTSVTKDINNMMSFEQMKDMADMRAQEYFSTQEDEQAKEEFNKMSAHSSIPTPPADPTAKPPDAFTVPSAPHKRETFTVPSAHQRKDSFTGDYELPPEGFAGSSLASSLQKFVTGSESFIDAPVRPRPEGSDLMSHTVPEPAGNDKAENFATVLPRTTTQSASQRR